MIPGQLGTWLCSKPVSSGNKKRAGDALHTVRPSSATECSRIRGLILIRKRGTQDHHCDGKNVRDCANFDEVLHARADGAVLHPLHVGELVIDGGTLSYILGTDLEQKLAQVRPCLQCTVGSLSTLSFPYSWFPNAAECFRLGSSIVGQ